MKPGIASRIVVLALGAAGCATLVAGCGESRQDAGEPRGRYEVQVARASFSRPEAIARPATLTIAVRNTGEKPLPDVAVTVDSLSYEASEPAELADRERPTWVIDTGPGPVAKPPVETTEVNPPGGAQTAFVHTWALGRLEPHATKVFRWKLTPVRAGTHTVHYEVSAGLYGKARAVTASGSSARGTLIVAVAGRPPATHVNAETGAVAEGAYNSATGPVGAVP
ncbi:MAG: hypothetical protein ACYCUM_03380 [Solirubrobacteraceae bacterium]